MISWFIKIFHDFGTLQRIKRSCGSRDMERVYLYQYAIHSLGLLFHLPGFMFSFPRIGIIRSLNLTPIVIFLTNFVARDDFNFAEKYYVTWQMSLVEQELFTIPEYPSSPRFFWGSYCSIFSIVFRMSLCCMSFFDFHFLINSFGIFQTFLTYWWRDMVYTILNYGSKFTIVSLLCLPIALCTI